MTYLGTPRRKLLALVALVTLVVVGSGTWLGGSVRRIEAVTGPAVFNAGAIISDYNFFNPNAMTEGDIQAFLEARHCAPRDASPCLWEYRETTKYQPAQGAGHCNAYLGARAEPASRIIAKVARACTISPRVLLVLLQKEQSLLTRPSASGYLRATGYGCPDTADCDTEYFGFFNQVYHAAWQFRQYTQKPERAYKVGTVEVGFNPDAACGASSVTIRNQATANLYNYTPYQPNAAALAHPGADGDGCSTHGNLNFWLFYNTWFGSSDSVGYPSIFASCLNLVGGTPCRAPGLLPGS
jgi:hypothetical protein